MKQNKEFVALVQGPTKDEIYSLTGPYVGAESPENKYKNIWLDTANNHIKIKEGNQWNIFGVGGFAKINTAVNIPVSNSVIIIDDTQDQDNTAMTFTTIPPAGTIIHVLLYSSTNTGNHIILPDTTSIELQSAPKHIIIISDGENVYCTPLV